MSDATERLAAHAMRLFMKAADQRHAALLEVCRTANWNVDGLGSKKQQAHERLAAAVLLYEAARTELQCAIDRAESGGS